MPTCVDQVVDRPLAVADRIEDPPPRRLGDHLEDVERSGHVREYTSLHIYVQADVASSEWAVVDPPVVSHQIYVRELTPDLGGSPTL